MKFSKLWLHEWIHSSIDDATLIDKMTMSGFKVNMVEPVSDYFNNVVIGNIVHVEIHPCNYNVYINKVDIGNGCYLNILSKSKKCRINLRVAVALISEKFSSDIQIKHIRNIDEQSEGMLCSFSSLGIVYNNVNDIIELPTNAPIGANLREYLQLDDNIIDVTITPNRGDCLSFMGVANDISAIYRVPKIFPKIGKVIPVIDDILSVSIEAPEACPCYFSRILKNIDLTIPTPLWMKERLRRCGMQLTNVVIDITNYVLLELGQPIHVFNLDNIYGGINIRVTKQEEKIFLLYNKNKIILNKDTLIVSDQSYPIGIAGILVGDNFTVNTSKISNIVLESAFFNPLYILRSEKEYGITTYSSYRYVRQGVNPDLSKLALERVTYFLVNICGGLPGKISYAIYKSMLPKHKIIILRKFKLNQLLSCVIHDDEIMSILTHLGCKVQYEQLNSSWRVIIPIFRFDIKVEEDLIEEIVRLYGYDKIIGTSIYTKLNNTKKNSGNILSLSRSKNLLVDLGYQEVITYSFVDPKIQYLLYPNNKYISLINPLTLDMSVMRLSLWIGLLKSVIYNQNRQQKNIRLFECGKCFIPDKNDGNKIYQHFMLSGIITGSRFDEHWDIVSETLNFYDIKGDVESLLEINGILNNIKFVPRIHSALHPGQTAAIFLNEEYVGIIGVIHPCLKNKLNLQANTFVFELFWDKISKSKISSKFFKLPKFPINRRDISIIVSESISADTIISECKKIMKDQLIDIKLFDVYRGQKIPKGFKSFSIALYIYKDSHTLHEQEITSMITECMSVLQDRFQVFFRKN